MAPKKTDTQPLQSSTASTPTSSVGNDLPERKTKFCTGFTMCKIFVVIYAILFLIIGLLLLIVGLWIQGIQHNYDSINDFLLSPTILSIVVGIVMIITAFCGLIGAFRESIILLKIFLAIIIIVFIFQVIIGIIAFVHRKETADLAGDQFEFAIKHYHEDEKLADAVDLVQQKFRCCGLDEPNDWEFNKEYSCTSTGNISCSVPLSCCKDMELDENCGQGVRLNNTQDSALRKQGINTTGCKWFFLMWVEDHLDAVGATALGLAIPQILGIFLVYVFIQKIQDRIYLYKYRKRIYQE